MKWLRGLGVPPVVVGIARGVLEAALMAGLIALAASVSALDFGDKAYLAPLVYFAIRSGEGLVDHIDPEKKRAPDSGA